MPGPNELILTVSCLILLRPRPFSQNRLLFLVPGSDLWCLLLFCASQAEKRENPVRTIRVAFIASSFFLRDAGG